jgi:hypothetical protein
MGKHIKKEYKRQNKSLAHSEGKNGDKLNKAHKTTDSLKKIVFSR